ncbi:hypothetical protein [Mycobacteroides abscessus]|uniref:hypothetical protein n=1 Tax=Mycobacteroides abscessus TaxID=36809 RepID=UPI00025882A8|nr:hypothetical protein [Mycobacteroides abscessus]EIC62265.1 hypothetical protein S7W_24071 [Mycobacteroides abscessus M94]SKZ51096.1 Uncharacterised protein [Mycobacteroides abscessus subsp. abscessus]
MSSPEEPESLSDKIAWRRRAGGDYWKVVTNGTQWLMVDGNQRVVGTPFDNKAAAEAALEAAQVSAIRSAEYHELLD